MSKIITDKDKIEELLTRGVGDFFDPDGIFRKKLETNPEKIIIKFGVDPTRPDIHLGHAVVFRKLRQFQDLGCKVIFLIGDLTAQIGDPTGKDQTRPIINGEEIISNANTYLKQVGAILDISTKDKYEILRNSIWYRSITDFGGDKASSTEKANLFDEDIKIYQTIRSDGAVPTITLFNFLATLRHVTHSQLIERDMFQKRINSGNHLYMHEMMYPVLQGIDSYAIAKFFDSCDLEVGGTDQTFNMLMGRSVMKFHNEKPQAVLSFKLLEGLDGKEKMSKSLGNYIGITDEPSDMYGKVMSIPDSSIGNYFELCTTTSLEEVEKTRKGILDGSIHPKEKKMDLAKQIVSLYYSEKEALNAQENWENTFSKKEIPSDVLEIKVNKDDLLIEIFSINKIVSSKNDFRRLVEEGAITNLDTDEKVSESTEKVKNGVYRIGKKRFCKIIIK